MTGTVVLSGTQLTVITALAWARGEIVITPLNDSYGTVKVTIDGTEQWLVDQHGTKRQTWNTHVRTVHTFGVPA